MLAEFQADLRRFHRSSAPLTAGRSLRLIADHFGLQALAWYRFARWIQVRAVEVPSPPWRAAAATMRLLARVAGRIYGIYLDPRVEIGPGLYIGHCGGIRLTRCHVGAGCSIGQRVRIGSAEEPEGPTVGDRVWIGCHVSIQGSLRVGSGATVGAGAVITRDVPEGALIVGNPARIIQRDYENAGIL